jgi:DNA-binding MarR family transcriptional regulator
MHALDDPRLAAAVLFTEVYAGLMAKTFPALAAAGLSESEFSTLLKLAKAPRLGLRMGDLTARSSLSASGITRVVDRLERHELVRRQAWTADRRTSYVVLTDAGAERLEALLPTHIQDIERWFTGLLPPEQFDDLLTGLRLIRDVVLPCATAEVTPTDTQGETVTTA